jgi:hypothetical protein
MLNDRDREHAQAKSRGFHPSQRHKLCRTDCGRWDTTLFQLDGIVDTPRRTGASIANGVNNDITLSQAFHHLGWCWGTRTLVTVDHLSEVETLFESVPYRTQEQLAVWFAIAE